MKIVILLTSLMLSSYCLADDRQIIGRVINLAASSGGISFRLDSGIPNICSQSPSTYIEVKANNIGALHLISSVMDKQIEVFADYDPIHMECVAKVVACRPC